MGSYGIQRGSTKSRAAEESAEKAAWRGSEGKQQLIGCDWIDVKTRKEEADGG